jgi:hypothetical protein
VRALAARDGAICLLGNHEEKYVRYHRWALSLAATGGRPPMRFSQAKLAIYARLDEADHAWLAGLPYYHLGDDFLVVHAGICPHRHRTIGDLDLPDYRGRLLRLRDIDADGNMVSLGEPRRPGQHHWSESYDGRLGLVIYGHQVYEGVRERPHAIGIDTGCCFGGGLTALVFADIHDRHYVSVPARARYARYEEHD